MSRTNAGGWMKLNCGDPVCRKDDPRHTGRVIEVGISANLKIKWDGTASISWEFIEDVERAPE